MTTECRDAEETEQAEGDPSELDVELAMDTKDSPLQPSIHITYW